MFAEFLCSVLMMSVIFLIMVLAVWLIFTQTCWLDISSLNCVCKIYKAVVYMMRERRQNKEKKIKI